MTDGGSPPHSSPASKETEKKKPKTEILNKVLALLLSVVHRVAGMASSERLIECRFSGLT